MPDIQPSPTVDQVVVALNRSTPPSSVSARLSAFHPLSGILSLLVVLLLGAFVILSWYLVRHFEGLVGDIRSYRTRIAADSRLPQVADDHLLDGALFAKELEAAPQRAAQLHVQRARLLVRHDDDAGAGRDYACAFRLNQSPLTIDDRLEWARILTAAGEQEQARALLHRLDGAAIDDNRRQRLCDLLLGWLAARRSSQDLQDAP